MNLLYACQELLRNRLSTTTGHGDPGMVFDKFDATVERGRRGYVSFDLDAVDTFAQTVADLALTPELQSPVWVVAWEDEDGKVDAQAYTSEDAARRDYGPQIDTGHARLVESTVQS